MVRKRISIDVTLEQYKWLKIQAIKHEKTIKDLVLNAVKEHCKKPLIEK